MPRLPARVAGHDISADVPADGEDEGRMGREEAECRRGERDTQIFLVVLEPGRYTYSRSVFWLLLHIAFRENTSQGMKAFSLVGVPLFIFCVG